jgi:hypothetical protein
LLRQVKHSDPEKQKLVWDETSQNTPKVPPQVCSRSLTCVGLQGWLDYESSMHVVKQKGCILQMDSVSQLQSNMFGRILGTGIHLKG